MTELDNVHQEHLDTLIDRDFIVSRENDFGVVEYSASLSALQFVSQVRCSEPTLEIATAGYTRSVSMMTRVDLIATLLR